LVAAGAGIQQRCARNRARASRHLCQRRAASRAEYPLRIWSSMAARRSRSAVHCACAGVTASVAGAGSTRGRVLAAGGCGESDTAPPETGSENRISWSAAAGPQGRSVNTGVPASRQT
jgi:hypothetical protein